jgi:hypothetical protein
VAAVGLSVSFYQLGDEVFGMLPFAQGHGAHAQYVVASLRVFIPKPQRLDHVPAATIPTVGLTAWQALAWSPTPMPTSGSVPIALRSERLRPSRRSRRGCGHDCWRHTPSLAITSAGLTAKSQRSSLGGVSQTPAWRPAGIHQQHSDAQHSAQAGRAR